VKTTWPLPTLRTQVERVWVDGSSVLAGYSGGRRGASAGDGGGVLREDRDGRLL